MSTSKSGPSPAQASGLYETSFKTKSSHRKALLPAQTLDILLIRRSRTTGWRAGLIGYKSVAVSMKVRNRLRRQLTQTPTVLRSVTAATLATFGAPASAPDAGSPGGSCRARRPTRALAPPPRRPRPPLLWRPAASAPARVPRPPPPATTASGRASGENLSCMENGVTVWQLATSVRSVHHPRVC